MSQTNKNVLIRPNDFIEAETIEYLRRCSINCAEQPLKMSTCRTLLLRQALFYFYLCCAVQKAYQNFVVVATDADALICRQSRQTVIRQAYFLIQYLFNKNRPCRKKCLVRRKKIV